MVEEIKQEGAPAPKNDDRQETIKNFLHAQINSKYQDLCRSIDSIPCLPVYEEYKKNAIFFINSGFLYIKEFFEVMQLKPFEQPKVQVDVESKTA